MIHSTSLLKEAAKAIQERIVRIVIRYVTFGEVTSMSPDQITAWATAGGVVVAALTILVTVVLYLRDQHQQQAAQTRQDLQTVIGDCNRFLRPLSEDPPYPIIHTVTAITKEFSSRIKESPHDVSALVGNEDLLRSICVEGWISSTQILRMMDIVEKVEREASSHNLRGKLLLICDASFLLAGIVAKVCSPESFYQMLLTLNLRSHLTGDMEDLLNFITVELQGHMCKKFDTEFRETIKQNLYLIQIAAGAFINLKDRRLRHLARTPEGMRLVSSSRRGRNPSVTLDETMNKIRKKTSLPKRVETVKKHLERLERDINGEDYTDLYNLITAIEKKCKTLSKDNEDCNSAPSGAEFPKLQKIE